MAAKIAQDSARGVLQTATKAAHVKLEEIPINCRIFADDYSELELADFYSRMCAIYRTLEPRLIGTEPASYINYVPRLPLLEQGLKLLNVPTSSNRQYDFQQLEDPGSCWGVLYVIQGSTWGGQGIFKKLSPRFKSEVLDFFKPNGEGEQHVKYWNNFCKNLELALVDIQALDCAKTSALQTFNLFHQGLGDKTENTVQTNMPL